MKVIEKIIEEGTKHMQNIQDYPGISMILYGSNLG